jgi:hypothetical protein
MTSSAISIVVKTAMKPEIALQDKKEEFEGDFAALADFV